MKEKAVIKSIKDGIAVVSTIPGHECTDCKSCGGSVPRQIEVSLKEGHGYGVGDEVFVDIPDKLLLQVYFFIYAMPLTVFIVSILFSYNMLKNPIISFTVAVILTAISFSLIGKVIKNKPDLKPRIYKS